MLLTGWDAVGADPADGERAVYHARAGRREGVGAIPAGRQRSREASAACWPTFLARSSQAFDHSRASFTRRRIASNRDLPALGLQHPCHLLAHDLPDDLLDGA